MNIEAEYDDDVVDDVKLLVPSAVKRSMSKPLKRYWEVVHIFPSKQSLSNFIHILEGAWALNWSLQKASHLKSVDITIYLLFCLN